MKRVWVDSNLIIRLVTGDPPEQASRAAAFISKAEQGNFKIVVAPLIVAECVWVLSSFYKFSRETVAEALGKVLTNSGLNVLEERDVQRALVLMAQKNVAFVDAYLATKAQVSGDSVASFDQDHRKLSVDLTTIE